MTTEGPENDENRAYKLFREIYANQKKEASENDALIQELVSIIERNLQNTQFDLSKAIPISPDKPDKEITPLEVANVLRLETIIPLLQQMEQRMTGEITRHDALGEVETEAEAEAEISPLHRAAADGDLDTVLSLIKEGANVNMQTMVHGINCTPLHLAAVMGHLAIVKALLENGADVNIKTQEGYTAEDLAKHQSHDDIAKQIKQASRPKKITLKELLAKDKEAKPAQFKRDPDFEDVDFSSPIILATLQNQFTLEQVKSALRKYDPNINLDLSEDDVFKMLIQIYRENTPSKVATKAVAAPAKDKRIREDMTLAEYKALKEKRARKAQKAARKQAEGIKAMIAARAIQVHEAVKSGDVSKLQQYIIDKVDLDRQDKDENTPLHLAAVMGREDLAEMLIRGGAGIKKIENDIGLSPIQYAAIAGQANVVKILLDNGASVNEKNSKGETLLLLAASRGHLAVVKLLLERGADVNMADNNNERPLHVAANQGHPKVVQALIESGANRTLLNNDGNTPLQEAINGGNEEVVALLRAKVLERDDEKAVLEEREKVFQEIQEIPNVTSVPEAKPVIPQTGAEPLPTFTAPTPSKALEREEPAVLATPEESKMREKAKAYQAHTAQEETRVRIKEPKVETEEYTPQRTATLEARKADVLAAFNKSSAALAQIDADRKKAAATYAESQNPNDFAELQRLTEMHNNEMKNFVKARDARDALNKQLSQRPAAPPAPASTPAAITPARSSMSQQPSAPITPAPVAEKFTPFERVDIKYLVEHAGKIHASLGDIFSSHLKSFNLFVNPNRERQIKDLQQAVNIAAGCATKEELGKALDNLSKVIDSTLKDLSKETRFLGESRLEKVTTQLKHDVAQSIKNLKERPQQKMR